MARSYAGGARAYIKGSIGSETYSVGRDGRGKKQQIVRSKPVEVSNPRTQAQAAQRLKAKPIQFARNLMADLINHSFRGVAVGNESIYQFMRLNMAQTDVPYQSKGDINNELGGYQISDGGLMRLIPDYSVSANRFDASYNKTVVGLSGISLPVASDSFGSEYNSLKWADVSRWILAHNPMLQNGDEIAVVLFYNVSSNSGHSVAKVARRMVIDTDYAPEVPESMKVQILNSEGAVTSTIDTDLYYAAVQYNEDFPIPAASRFWGELRSGANFGWSFMQVFFGVFPTDADNTGATIGLGGVSLNDDVNSFAPAYNYIVGDDAFADGKFIGGAVVVSRLENGSWNFSVSEIGLQKAYLDEVNSSARLAAALQSYMAEDGVATSSDTHFLRLSDGSVTQVGTTNQTFDVNVRNAEGTVVAASVQMSAVGLTALADGTRYLYVDDNDIVLQYAGGPALTYSYTPEGGEATTIDIKSTFIIQYAGRVISFVKSDAVLA